MQSPSASNMPEVPVTPDDLAIIHRVMHPYKVFLQHRVPPSEQQQATILLTDNLCFRIAFTLRMLAQGKEVTLAITVDEADVIDNALEVFITLLEKIFPQEESRDIAIADCRQLRKKLAPVIASESTRPQHYH